MINYAWELNQSRIGHKRQEDRIDTHETKKCTLTYSPQVLISLPSSSITVPLYNTCL